MTLNVDVEGPCSAVEPFLHTALVHGELSAKAVKVVSRDEVPLLNYAMLYPKLYDQARPGSELQLQLG